MAQTTVFVLVPGSFSPPSYYDKLVPLLEAWSFGAFPTELKSVNDGDGETFSMYDDAAHIHSVIARLADEGKSVVLVMNSYGGIPGTEASKGLSRAERQAAGEPGALTRMVYLSSFVADAGGSINKIMAGRMPEQEQLPSGYLTMNPDTDAAYIFSHLSQTDQLEYARRLRKHSARTFDDELTHAGYMNIPSTYVLCTDDLVVPLELQRQMVDAAKQRGASFQEHEIHSDHCPMISHPDEVLKVLMDAVER